MHSCCSWEVGKILRPYSRLQPNCKASLRILQHVLQRIQTANTSAINSNSASVAEALHARPASRRKRTAETQDADTDEMSVQPHQRRQRRRVVPAFVMPAGTAVLYHRKLLTDPAAYCVPLTAGSWALPGYSIASNKLVAQSLVQVRCQASLVYMYIMLLL